MRRLVLAVCLLSLMCSPAAAWRQVASGSQCAFTSPAMMVLGSPKEVEALWSRARDIDVPPGFDFKKEVLVAVFAGTRPTAGYTIDVIRMSLTDGGLDGAFKAVPPQGMAAQVITSPWLLLAMPR